MVDLAARHRRLAEDAEAQTLRVLRSGGYIGGPEVQSFCREVAESLSCRHAVGVGSGTEALILSLKALGIGPGHRVLVPALSFFASVESILYVGAEPVFAELAEGLEHNDIEARIGGPVRQLPFARLA